MDRFMRVRGTVGLVFGAGFAFILVLIAGSRESSKVYAAPASAQDVYLDKCSICHGQDGAGNTAKGRKLKVKDVRSPEVQKLTEAEMVDIVAKGKGKDMDGFQKELGADTVKEITIYYRSLAK